MPTAHTSTTTCSGWRARCAMNWARARIPSSTATCSGATIDSRRPTSMLTASARHSWLREPGQRELSRLQATGPSRVRPSPGAASSSAMAGGTSSARHFLRINLPRSERSSPRIPEKPRCGRAPEWRQPSAPIERCRTTLNPCHSRPLSMSRVLPTNTANAMCVPRPTVLAGTSVAPSKNST